MKTFEENLQRLEKLTNDIKQSDISLEDAIKDFEEGIKLAKTMEKELNSIEAKVQQLMNNPDIPDDDASDSEEVAVNGEKPAKKRSTKKANNEPVLDLFNTDSELNGTRNA